MKYTDEQIENIVYEYQLMKEVARDMRTPLNTISGFVMLLMKNADDPAKVREYAHQIGVSCQDLLVMYNQTEYLKGDMASEHDEVVNEEFALGKVIEDTTNIARTWMRYKYVDLEVITSGLESDIFIGDRVLITEVLRNLIANAIQYTPEGGTLTFSVSRQPCDDPGYCDITFRIHDSGEAMSQEIIKRIFDGTGTGIFRDNVIAGRMPVVKKYIEKMGGTISAQSSPGEGNTFTVMLHLQVVDHSKGTFWSDRGLNRVLVVGENLGEAERIASLLRNTGLDAKCTCLGYSALKLVEQASMEEKGFDLILLDRDIKDQKYTKFKKQLRSASFNKAPTVVLMSDKAEHFTSEVHKSGIAAIMPKPFFYSTFKEIVEKIDFSPERTDSIRDRDDVNPLQGRRILIVEDGAIQANVTKELLEVEGARCELAGNGKAAIAMFRNSRAGYYDAILMDVRMPVEDGYSAAKEIRALHRSDSQVIPILAMVAGDSEIDKKRAKESGITAHCSKPPDILEVNQILRTIR